MRKLRRSPFGSVPKRRGRLSPLMLVGALVTIIVVLVGAIVFVVALVYVRTLNKEQVA